MRARNRQAATTGRPVSPNLRAKVISLHLDAARPYVTVDDGLAQYPIYEQAGFLPAVGDWIVLTRVGDDPTAMAPRYMVSGDMQSKNFITMVAGWRLTAEGNFEANNAFFRGDVTATAFRTGGATVPHIFISSADKNTIQFPRPDSSELLPARITALLGVLKIEGQEFSVGSGARSALELHGYPTAARLLADTINLDVNTAGGHVKAAGMSINRPLHLELKATGANNSVANATVHTLKNFIHVGNFSIAGESTIEYNFTNGNISPKVAGVYEITVAGDFPVPSSGDFKFQTGYSINAFGQNWMHNGQVFALAHLGQAASTWTLRQRFNGSTDIITIVAYQTSGVAKEFTLRSVYVRYLHPLSS